MMSMRKFLVCGTAFLSASVFAQGGYVGVSVGQSDLGVSGAEDDTSYGIMAGYQLNDNLALEAGYTMYGDFEYSDSPEYSEDLQGINLNVVGSLPVNETVSLFAKGGFLFWTSDYTYNGQNIANTNDGTDLVLGFGVEANITPQLSVTGEYQRADIEQVDLSNFSVGARYHF